MSEHDIVTGVGLRERMEHRFLDLHESDNYNGEHAGEYNMLSTVLSDAVMDDGELTMDGILEGSLVSATDVPCDVGKESGCGGGDCRPTPGSPLLLTGGFSCTSPSSTPMSGAVDVPEFSHGGYDGGVMVGFDGTWDTRRFERLLTILEESKELAGEYSQDGLEGFPLNLDGTEVLVSAKGGLAGGDSANGGVVYKYRFHCQGVEFMIHSKPCQYIQPVRVRYAAESVQGHRDRFYDVHFGFVCPFLESLGLKISADKLSRVDLQCLVDDPVSEFVRLFQEGHVVTKLRKKAIYGSMTRDETIELGSVGNAQFCFYDKGRELRSKKSNIVKEALFVRDCVGDEWHNSDRPITRVEIRLGRDALKCLGVSSVSDLQKSERGVVDLLTTEWFRILEHPKVRGHESTASVHPLW